MSEQVVDLRSSWAVIRRRSGLLAIAALVGGLAGAGLFYLFPPQYSSMSVVLLPAGTSNASGESTAYDAETQALIAESSEVLGLAGEKVSPSLTPAEVEERVSIAAPSPSILRFTATADTAAGAEALASALADAHVTYLRSNAAAVALALSESLEERQTTLQQSLDALNAEMKKTSDRLAEEDRTSPEGRADAAALAELTAQRAETVLELDDIGKQLEGGGTTGAAAGGAAGVIQDASPAERAGLTERVVVLVLGGAVFAVLLTVGVLLTTTRRDARLRSRDELAASVGIPVLASLASRSARSASGWTDLLHGYAPANIDAWALRQLLRQVAPRSGDAGDEAGGVRGVLVLCLADDARALAAGPQLASFAASTGIRTTLVAAQFNEAASTLWAACSRGTDDAPPRKRLTVTTRSEQLPDAGLVVALAVLDPAEPVPSVPDLDGLPVTTLLAVSSGAVTAQGLADVAVASDNAGHYIEGLLVTDPDPLDRTTGQLGGRDRRSAPAATVHASTRPSRPVAVPDESARRARNRKRARQ